MGNDKHKWFPVKQLCGRDCCEKRAQVGNSGTLGRRGKQVKDRTQVFKDGSRNAWKKDEGMKYRIARNDLGTASVSYCDQVGYAVQAHHMIAKSVYKEEDFWIFASRAGWDIDNGRNCILLPTHWGWQMWDRLQYHKSGHSEAFFQVVRDELRQIVKGFTVKDFCKKDRMRELHERFHVSEDDLFEQLKQDCFLELYDDSNWLYGDDYKDEKGMKIDQARVWQGKKFRRERDWYSKPKKPGPRCVYSLGGIAVVKP
jgi:hypothetical protein